MFRVYARCNSGHYFIGTHCPLDGWTSEEVEEIARAADGTTGADRCSLSALSLTPEARRRCIVIEFGADENVFDALAIDLVARGGVIIRASEFGSGDL